jgi:hypothetical protein
MVGMVWYGMMVWSGLSRYPIGVEMPAPLLPPAPPLMVRHGLLRGQLADPLWVDWAKIERAQATFAKYYSAFFLGLLSILMQVLYICHSQYHHLICVNQSLIAYVDCWLCYEGICDRSIQ